MGSKQEVSRRVQVKCSTTAVFHAPARDTLIHEVLCMRIAGDPVQCIEAWWMLNESKRGCPWGVPVGPGWDHLYEEAKR